FLLIFFDHLVSTYFGGHLVHQSTQQQKVRGNSRLLIIDGDPLRDIRILGAPKHLRLVMVGERLAKNDLL
ncbi:hypothetical protein, partial [Mesorhizobium sp. M0060]|uniref:hypothetical protein n=1 Tax=Mesorhizobium sp. M0060 TaxID=2956866 RepID=UPI00333D2CF5